MKRHAALALVLGMIFSGAASVQAQDFEAEPMQNDRKLDVGDPAPGLDIEEWVKGSETTIEKGKVYVVEFWATWCAPCRKSIPHLSKLQEEYGDKGLVIIGVSNEETDVVRPFVERQGKQMGYTVAVDRRKSTTRAWFEAAGRQGIPAAFVVDREGRVAWMGHPLDEVFDEVIYQTVKGRYNAKLGKEAKPIVEQARLQRKMRNWQQAKFHYDKCIALDPQVFALIALEKFEMLLVDMNDREGAYKYAREELLGKSFTNDAEAAGKLALKVASDPKISDAQRDMDFALEAATQAQTLMGATDPEGWRFIAQVYWSRGEADKAYQSQLQAWKLAKPKYKEELRRELDTYHSEVKSGSR